MTLTHRTVTRTEILRGKRLRARVGVLLTGSGGRACRATTARGGVRSIAVHPLRKLVPRDALVLHFVPPVPADGAAPQLYRADLLLIGVNFERDGRAGLG